MLPVSLAWTKTWRTCARPHRPALPRTPPDKTMLTLEGALVGQQQVQSRKLHKGRILDKSSSRKSGRQYNSTVTEVTWKTSLLPLIRSWRINYRACVTSVPIPKRFRELVREIAALLAYEATADLLTIPRQIETPLASDDRCGTKGEDRPGADLARRAGHGGRASGN